jgi:hypothetical protein
MDRKSYRKFMASMNEGRIPEELYDAYLLFFKNPNKHLRKLQSILRKDINRNEPHIKIDTRNLYKTLSPFLQDETLGQFVKFGNLKLNVDSKKTEPKTPSTNSILQDFFIVEDELRLLLGLYSAYLKIKQRNEGKLSTWHFIKSYFPKKELQTITNTINELRQDKWIPIDRIAGVQKCIISSIIRSEKAETYLDYFFYKKFKSSSSYRDDAHLSVLIYLLYKLMLIRTGNVNYKYIAGFLNEQNILLPRQGKKGRFVGATVKKRIDRFPKDYKKIISTVNIEILLSIYGNTIKSILANCAEDRSNALKEFVSSIPLEDKADINTIIRWYLQGFQDLFKIIQI